MVALFLSATLVSAEDKIASFNVNEFRYPLIEMQDIVSPTKLSHRIFYKEPSKGVDALWFDVVKKGD